MYKSTLLFVFLSTLIVASPNIVFSQDVEPVWMPTLSYSYKQNSKLGFNSKTSAYITLNDATTIDAMSYIESQLAFSYSYSVRFKYGGSYLLKLNNPASSVELEHRLSQQAGYIFFLGDNRTAHQVKTEQRFKEKSYENRWRYKLSYDFPLTGERLDINETYLAFSNELLSSFNTDWLGLDNRFYIGYGWNLPKKRVFEIGLEHRFSKLFHTADNGHTLLLKTSYYLR